MARLEAQSRCPLIETVQAVPVSSVCQRRDSAGTLESECVNVCVHRPPWRWGSHYIAGNKGTRRYAARERGGLSSTQVLRRKLDTMIKVDAGRLWRRDYPLHAKPVGVVWLAARLAARVVPHRGGTRLASSLRKRLRSPPAVGDQSGAAEGVRVLRHETSAPILRVMKPMELKTSQTLCSHECKARGPSVQGLRSKVLMRMGGKHTLRLQSPKSLGLDSAHSSPYWSHSLVWGEKGLRNPF